MSENTGSLRCTFTCWATGGLAGVLAIALLLVVGDFSWPGAIFTGLVLAIVLGALLSWLLCRDLPTMDEMKARRGAATTSAAPRPGTGATTPAAAPTAATTAAAASPVAAPAATPEPAPAPETAPQLAPSPAPVASTAEGTKPDLLSAPRNGGADDLKLIKGVGPKLEGQLHAMGVYHFDQIAQWGPAEVQWMDDNLEGFKGRVSRDEWVEQARTLASGH